MSRIFEALQRSESERTGGGISDLPSMVTELLEAAERQAPAAVVPAAVPPPELGQAHSIPVVVSPETRLVSLTEKESLAAEKFRFLGVRLRQLQQARQLRKLLITSTAPEEGKSLVSANLATTLARRQQQKVLLLEGDLRRPVLARQLGHPRLPGITEWLYQPTGPINSIYYLDGPGFWLLPAGQPPENPLELMQSGRLNSLLEQLTSSFDWIIIDSPPLLPLADTSVWTRLADGVLLVVREGKTEKRHLQRGLAALDQNKLLGVVVNNCAGTDNKNYYSRYSPGGAGPEGPQP
ncbi:MAG TPA: CpsD/CapB family tyrosine-protein kinase [Terriglobales bacterium]|jgi:capsular exopolysaccharide synthesis family protein